MRRMNIVLVPALIALIFLGNVSDIFSNNRDIIPYNIKVGLFFGTTAKSTLLIESQTGFEVGNFEQDEFVNLFNLDEDKILLRKDQAYIGQGLNFKEYIGSINNQSNLFNVEGPYHVQIGENFSSYEEANSFLDSINMSNVHGYLSYENDWKVFVGLYLDESKAKEEANNIKSTHGYETKVIDPSATRVQVINSRGNTIFMYDSSKEVYFMGKNNKNNVPLVSVEGTRYRGGITAKRLSNSDMTVINKLPLEEYLYAVVPAEMYVSWPIEALKAQAVAARGYALTNLNKYKQFDFNLCDTINSQVYKGYDREHPNTNKAVDETRSKVVTYNGSLVQPYYHSNSGGRTEDSENVWTSSLPHIRGVKDDFSLDEQYSTWTTTFTKDEIKSKLATHNIFIGDILDIKINSTSNSGRVMSLTIYGTEGQEVMEKQKSRTVLGLNSNYFTINSNNSNSSETELAAINGSGSGVQTLNTPSKYVITADGVHEIKNINLANIFNGKEYKSGEQKPIRNVSDTFVIEGKGSGHGLGMSQYGAKKMAELGYKYNEILNHYYTGVKVE